MEPVQLIIIGGGPAAWSAGLYAARAELKPLILAGEKWGGQLTLTTVVENYPGFPQGIDGPQLMLQMREQAEKFGATVIEEAVENVEQIPAGDGNKFGRTWFQVTTSKQQYQARAAIVATGAESIWLNVPGEKELVGRGVSVCAVCDAAFFRGKKTFVIGGGDAAMEDALALTRFAESVTIIHRRNVFRASKVMVDRVLCNPKITILWNSVVEQVIGETKVIALKVKNLETGTTEEIPADGMFVAIGHRPTTDFIKDTVNLNRQGYVITRIGLDKPSVEAASTHIDEKGMVLFPTMASVEGIFAAGDCVDFRYRQAAIASAWGGYGRFGCRILARVLPVKMISWTFDLNG